MRSYLIITIISLLFSVSCFGQISEGGMPKEIVNLKSTKKRMVDMPVFMQEMKVKNVNEKTNKPLRFAHAYKVHFNSENSGTWSRTSDGYFCWNLTIRSKGAKSLNLIFNNFELPENTRLFVFNEKENHFLGAYTSNNNKSSKKFAVSPVAGDEITIQYEVWGDSIPSKHFDIVSVNHDFLGIFDLNERRPLDKIAGDCNVDVNCDLGKEWSEVKNSVCRLIVNGFEICTGALINNTAEDQKPYVLSAAHCYDQWEYAETSVYVFNYESPYCAPLDGDASNSISGAVMKAQFDSLDFALAELSLVPPPEFRPYFAGWDHTENIPVSTTSIHHPQGDIKKISMDYDSPVISDFNSSYIKDAFLKIERWDHGVTEVGSSGGPLFDTDKNLIGTLTGGVALCDNPVRDYYARFSLSWDYKEDSTKQLKCWLDPLKSNVEYLEGEQFYEAEEYCNAFTNLIDDDEHDLISILNGGVFAGYWGGTNDVSITEIVEQFTLPANSQLFGISLGVAKVDIASKGTKSEITLKVYNGSMPSEEAIYSKNILIKDLVEDAMNFIGFDEVVEPEDTFYVGFELSNLQPLDTFAVYQSLRGPNTKNTFYFKQNDLWQNFKDANNGYNSMINVFELVACNLTDTILDTPIVDNPLEIQVFPNPTQSSITMEAGVDISTKDISVINLLGQIVEVPITKISPRKAKINLQGNAPGVYFVRFNNGEGYVSRKVSFVPW